MPTVAHQDLLFQEGILELPHDGSLLVEEGIASCRCVLLHSTTIRFPLLDHLLVCPRIIFVEWRLVDKGVATPCAHREPKRRLRSTIREVHPLHGLAVKLDRLGSLVLLVGLADLSSRHGFDPCQQVEVLL